jgi:hypothetical protein
MMIKGGKHSIPFAAGFVTFIIAEIICHISCTVLVTYLLKKRLYIINH